MSVNSLDADTMGPGKMQSPCHFMKLFDGYDPNGTLWEVRNKIYSYVWSRDRRDRAKFDWVLSQNGVNRNVPERFVQATPYQEAAFTSIDKLPCWLMLVNKKISAEFTEYIYSVNFLQIDVDLKAMHTANNEANLRRITTLLKNQNFVRYTQSVRVRIHFPYEYPFQNLSTFNQSALEDIATTLDTFESMEYMDVRIVPMQGPKDYELRFAAFPFYQMAFTDWSIHILNDTMTVWDMVDGEQVHRLNKAWSIYQATGSLTEPVHLSFTEVKWVPEAQIPNKGFANDTKNHISAQRKNGSQKRRHRMVKATIFAALDVGSTSATSIAAASCRPGTPVSASRTELPELKTPSQPVATEFEPPGKSLEERPAPEPPIASASDSTQIPSPTLPSSRHLEVDFFADTSAFDTSGEVILTPANSSESNSRGDVSPITQPATKVENTAETEPENFQRSRTPYPLSSAASSVTLGRSQEEGEALSETGKVLIEAEPSVNEGDCEKKSQKKKKRRNRKKLRKPETVDTAAIGVKIVEEEPAAAGVHRNESEEVDISHDHNVSRDESSNHSSGHLEPQIDNIHISRITLSKPDFPLSELADLRPFDESDKLCIGTRADGSRVIMARTRHTERYFRQQQRVAASRREREAEQTKIREKRQTKRAKEALLRRRESSHNLRFHAESMKQPNAGNRSSGLEEHLDTSDDSDDDFQTYDRSAGVRSEASDSGTYDHSCARDYGGSGNGDEDDENRGISDYSAPRWSFPAPDVEYADMSVLSHESNMLTGASDQSQHVGTGMEPEVGTSVHFENAALADEDRKQDHQENE